MQIRPSLVPLRTSTPALALAWTAVADDPTQRAGRIDARRGVDRDANGSGVAEPAAMPAPGTAAN